MEVEALHRNDSHSAQARHQAAQAGGCALPALPRGHTTPQRLAVQASTLLSHLTQASFESHLRYILMLFQLYKLHCLTSESSLGTSAAQTAMPLIRPLRIWGRACRTLLMTSVAAWRTLSSACSV